MDYVLDWGGPERDGLLSVTVSGPVDTATLGALMDELAAAATLRPIRILVDESSLEPGFITSMDVRSVARWWHETKGLSGSQVAVVATSDVMFGLNRMFQLSAGLPGDDNCFRLFRAREEALDWLRNAGVTFHQA